MAMPIPDDWDGTSWNCWMVEWPASVDWLAILCGFITQATRGRFWDASTGSVIAAQAIGFEIESRNRTEDFCMTCFSDLAEGLQAIADAIANSGAGCAIPGSTGTSGAGGTPATPSAFIDDGSSTFPAGYADRAEYEDWKCGLAETARQKWENDVASAKVLNLVGLTLSGLLFQFSAVGAVVFVTPVPFDDLVLIAVAMFAIVTLLIDLAAALQQAEDYVAVFDICIWHRAGDVQDAITDTEADIDGQTFALADAEVKTILKAFITTNMLNPLFDPKPDGADYGGIEDCSLCPPCVLIEALLQTDGGKAIITEIVPDLTYDVEAHFNTVNTRWEAIFAFNVRDDASTPVFCGPEQEISHTVVSGVVTPDPPPNAWRIFDQVGTFIWNANVGPAADFCSARWVIVSDTAFTLRIDIGSAC